MMPYEVFSPEQLTVTSGADPGVEVDLLCPSWLVLDLADLSIPAISLDNRAAPGVPGSNELDPIEDELRVSLPFHLGGDCDRSGNAYARVRTGFRRNWSFLVQHLFLPSEDSALDATYQPDDPDEDPIEFRIQFGTPTITERYPSLWVGTMLVVLPDGALVSREIGS